MKKLFLLATATAALMACSNNDEPVNNELIAARITANINGASETRATGTQWGTGDKIGVTCSSEDASYSNVEYITTKGDGNFATSTPFYFPDVNTEKSFTAYYPYKATSEMENGVITGSTAAENQTSANQPDIDYLWADTKTATGGSPNVNFSFAHKMSKLTLKFQQGGDVTLSDMQKYKLSSLVLEGTFNTTNGTAAAKTEGTTAGDLEMTVSDVSPDSNNEFSLILYPQEISNGLTLSVDVNDNLTYSCELKVDNAKLTQLAAGSNYSFTITVSKKGLTITNSTISDWTAVSGDAGTAYPG